MHEPDKTQQLSKSYNSDEIEQWAKDFRENFKKKHPEVAQQIERQVQQLCKPHSMHEPDKTQQLSKSYNSDEIKQWAKDFRENFRQKHPEVAKQIDEKLQPRHEKHVLAFEQQFKQYNKDLAENKLSPADKTQFEQRAAELAKDTLAMYDLKHKNPELAIQVENMAKTHEKQMQYVKEKDLSLEWER